MDPGRTRRVDAALRRVPWYFKLLGAVFAVYLAFRVYQGIDWLAGRL